MLLIERHEFLLPAVDLSLDSLHPRIDGAALGGVTLKLTMIGLKTGIPQPTLHVDRTDQNGLQVGVGDTDLGTAAFRYIARRRTAPVLVGGLALHQTVSAAAADEIGLQQARRVSCRRFRCRFLHGAAGKKI